MAKVVEIAHCTTADEKMKQVLFNASIAALTVRCACITASHGKPGGHMHPFVCSQTTRQRLATRNMPADDESVDSTLP